MKNITFDSSEKSRFNKSRRKVSTLDVDTDATFKMYGVNYDNISDAYYSSGCTFDKLISEDYSLNTPVMENNSIISLIEKRRVRGVDELDFSYIDDEEELNKMTEYAEKYAGQYVTSIVGMYLPINVAELFSDEKKINDFIASLDIADIQEVKLVTLPDNATNIIYIKSLEQEYAVPYSNKSDSDGYTNGALYEMDDFIKILGQH